MDVSLGQQLAIGEEIASDGIRANEDKGARTMLHMSSIDKAPRGPTWYPSCKLDMPRKPVGHPLTTLTMFDSLATTCV